MLTEIRKGVIIGFLLTILYGVIIYIFMKIRIKII